MNDLILEGFKNELLKLAEEVRPRKKTFHARAAIDKPLARERLEAMAGRFKERKKAIKGQEGVRKNIAHLKGLQEREKAYPRKKMPETYVRRNIPEAIKQESKRGNVLARNRVGSTVKGFGHYQKLPTTKITQAAKRLYGSGVEAAGDYVQSFGNLKRGIKSGDYGGAFKRLGKNLKTAITGGKVNPLTKTK